MTPSDFGVLENVRAITQQNTPNTQNVETLCYREIRFFMRLSGMRFRTKLFEHSKITSWHHWAYNSDNLKIQ